MVNLLSALENGLLLNGCVNREFEKGTKVKMDRAINLISIYFIQILKDFSQELVSKRLMNFFMQTVYLQFSPIISDVLLIISQSAHTTVE
ncbi:hypothetical protein SAMN03159341_102697 [Paenibacillus sp. 1_12]|nr:hypothetical protein SAMN03159341_102697 [Paenibacillus sp. 1_12]